MCGADTNKKQVKSVKKMVFKAKIMLFALFLGVLGGQTSFARAEGNFILASVNTKQSINKSYKNLSYPRLFGKKEQKYDDISAFTKWEGMFVRFQGQVGAKTHNKNMKKWDKMLRNLKDADLKTKVTAVNDFMNGYKFIPDSKNYKKRDYWATPLEFMKNGGDCEDYAISKYVSLRALGVPESQMRVAIVHDKVLGVPHAVLVVYDGKKAMVLDNQSDKVKLSKKIDRYKPIYSISQTAWWRH